MKHLVAVLAVGLLVTATACSQKSREPFRDTPVKSHLSNGAVVIEQPDGFNNVARTCDDTTAVYTLYHGNYSYGAIAVVPDAKVCGGHS